MKLTEIFGKAISQYDSWNGDHKTIQVETIAMVDKEIIITGKGYYGNTQRIYIPSDLFENLLESGKAESRNEIDHCIVTKEWRIVDF